MSKINRHPVRRTAAGVLAGALTLTGAVAVATPAAAAPTFGLDRISGEGRYETSAAIARAFIAANTGAVTNVILASGESTNTPDALAASFLAGVRNAPVVLTQRSTTPGATAAVLATLRTQGATTLTVVGGTAAVSEEQVTALRALGWTVERIGGANRYETAANIATAGEAGGTNGAASNVGLLASGTSTIDALAGGPVAFRGRHPLFLTTRDGIPGATVRSMQANGVTSVYILGGEAVVGPRVVAQLAAANITVVARLSGADRSATSVAIANAVIGGTFGFSATSFNVASGINGGVDALGGAALSGKQGRVLLVTNTATSAAPITAFATTRAAQLTTVGTIFGGTTVVAGALETALESAAGGSTTSNQTFTVTGGGSTVTAGNTTATPGTVTYTATAPAGTTVTIALFNADDVTTVGGQVRLTRNGNVANPVGAVTPATFTSINNVAVNSASPQTVVVPASGTITFTVQATTAGTGALEVVPVIFRDLNANGQLNVGSETTTAGAPTEPFGVGSPVVFVPAEATPGTITNEVVARVDLAAGFFTTTAGKRYNIRSTDNFQFATNPSTGDTTFANFTARLSAGDSVSGTYSPLTTSTFILNDVSPAAPTVTSTLLEPGSTVRLNISRVAAAEAYRVYRRVGSDEAFSTASYTLVGTVTQPASGNATFTDAVALPAGTNVRYFVRSVRNGQEGPLTDATSAGNVDVQLVAAGTVGTGAAPLAIDTVQTTNNGLSGTLGTGDVIRIVFNEDVTAASTVTLRLRDADATTNTVADITNANATFAVNTAALTVNGASRAAGRVLTVTLTADPTVVTAGTATGLQQTATITDQSGITDADGNAWVVSAGSQDVTVEVLGSDVVSGTAAPATPTAGTAVAGSSAGTATVNFTAPADNGAPITGFTITPSGGGTPVTVGAGATSASFTGLTSGATTFTVVASNSVGNSSASPASNSVTIL